MEEQVIKGSSRLLDYGVLGLMLLLFIAFAWFVVVPFIKQIAQTNEQLAKTNEEQGKTQVAQTEVLRQISENQVKVAEMISQNIPTKIEEAKKEIIDAVRESR